jgi:hypothetical protein
MATKKVALTERVSMYVDETRHAVDINKCFPGSHARAIKPGGVQNIMTSIKEDGYKRVSNSPPHPPDAPNCKRARAQRSHPIGVDDPGP